MLSIVERSMGEKKELSGSVEFRLVRRSASS